MHSKSMSFISTVGYRSLDIFRVSFFLGILLHFLPSFLHFSDNYSPEAYRVTTWNSYIFNNLAHYPFWFMYLSAILTGLSCLFCMAGYFMQWASFVCLMGLYFFMSVNSLNTHTLATANVVGILPLWILFDGSGTTLPKSSDQFRNHLTERRYLAGGILFQILSTVFFSGVEKVLHGWPFKNEMHRLFHYPEGLGTRDWVLHAHFLTSSSITCLLDWTTVVFELLLPFTLLTRRFRTVSVILYELFFLGVVSFIEVPLLFYFIFSTGILVLWQPKKSST